MIFRKVLLDNIPVQVKTNFETNFYILKFMEGRKWVESEERKENNTGKTKITFELNVAYTF